MIRLIHQELDRLSRVVNGIVESTRLEGGVLRLEKDSCRIEDLFSGIAGELQEFTRHHYLQLVLPSRLPPILIDRKKIQQVILNLTPCCKVFTEGSPIIIEARSNRGHLTISITDQGIGIPSQLKARLFEHFSQADNIIRRYKDQNDIGLPVCRGIIEAHGGKIQLVSQAGTGSRFTFQLPYITGSNRL